MAKSRTIRNGKLGNRSLRLVEKDAIYYGLADGKICTEGSSSDEVWQRLRDEAGKSDPKYFGYDGARGRFLKFFPDGFHSERFELQERDYKVAAKKKLDAAAPMDFAANGIGLGEAVLAVYRATNMLSQFETMRLQDVLRGPDSDSFVQAAARFAIEGSESALHRIAQILKPYDCAKWTVVTYLPFLWRPDVHMFLKPMVSTDYAARVGHPFASIYEAQLNFNVYAELISLVERTSDELTDLNPRDGIDIQSFIWIVGDYQEGVDDIPQPGTTD